MSNTLHGDVLPPGTQRINDSQSTHILLAPQPSSDPNQPLVCILQDVPITI